MPRATLDRKRHREFIAMSLVLVEPQEHANRFAGSPPKRRSVVECGRRARLHLPK